MQAPIACETRAWQSFEHLGGLQPSACISVRISAWSGDPLRFARRHPPHHLSPASANHPAGRDSEAGPRPPRSPTATLHSSPKASQFSSAFCRHWGKKRPSDCSIRGHRSGRACSASGYAPRLPCGHPTEATKEQRPRSFRQELLCPRWSSAPPNWPAQVARVLARSSFLKKGS
jgi:hypothetical protein